MCKLFYSQRQNSTGGWVRGALTFLSICLPFWQFYAFVSHVVTWWFVNGVCLSVLWHGCVYCGVTACMALATRVEGVASSTPVHRNILSTEVDPHCSTTLLLGIYRLTFGRPRLLYIIQKYSFRTSQRTQRASIRKTNQWQPRSEILLLWESHATHRYTVWANAEI
jgi:hypothetical protein